MAKKKIYISSTFGDLKNYRRRLGDTFRFLEKYFEIVRTMEYMMPGDPEPSALNQCLEDIRKADIYIIILGKRYGSLVKDKTISYTESEYDCAKEYEDKKEKIIIRLYADTDSSDFKNIVTDDLGEYTRFKTKVQRDTVKFGEDFTSPDGMCLQLMETLYRHSANGWEVDDEKRYLCNRESHYLGFMGAKKKDTLNVFAISGKQYDRAENFNIRMAKLQFKLQKEFIDSKIKFADIAGNSANEEKFMSNILAKIMDGFMDENEDRFDNPEDCFRRLADRDIEKIYLSIFLSKEDCDNKNIINAISFFLSTAKGLCIKTKITFYVVIVFEFPNEEKIDKKLQKKVTAIQAKFNAYDLDELGRIEFDHVEKWIAGNLFPPGYARSHTLAEKYFGDKTQSYSMADVDPILLKILDEINSGNPFIK